VTSDPTVRHVNEQELRIEQRRQMSDVRHQTSIGGAVFQSDENLLIHGVPASGDDLDEPGGETENV